MNTTSHIAQNQPQAQSGHTFSAKEKDDETGYSYFGARYYDSELSVWLSVDPMSDKYPSLSPYNYCAGNPIIYIDPNGEFKTKFGANLYKFFHGGTVTPATSENRKGEYFVSKSVENNTQLKFRGNNKSKITELSGPTLEEKVTWESKTVGFFKKINNAIENGGNHDCDLAGKIDAQDVAVGNAMISLVSGTGVLAEGTATLLQLALVGSDMLNSIDDLGTNSSGQSISQQLTTNNTGKSSIGLIKTLINGVNIGSGYKSPINLINTPSKAGGTGTDAVSIGKYLLEKIEN